MTPEEALAPTGRDLGSGELASQRVARPGPYPDPVPVSVVAAAKIGRSGLQCDQGAVLWIESRPSDGGRQVVVSIEPDGDTWSEPADVTPAGTSVRSRVHEYGGGAACVGDGEVFFVDQADQAWHRIARRSSVEVTQMVRLGPGAGEWPAGTSVRHGDGRLVRNGEWLVSVREVVDSSRTSHQLVALATDGPGPEFVLDDASDFVAAPRPSPDGSHLAWVAWDHPNMPWDSSVVRVAPLLDEVGADGSRRPILGPSRVVAGGPGRSVGQPTWCLDGSLVVLDDRSGWWLPYRIEASELRSDLQSCLETDSDGPSVSTTSDVPLVSLEGEWHDPDWALGQSTLAEMADGSLVARMHADGRDHLARLHPPDGGPAGRPWRLEIIEQPCVMLTGVVTPNGRGIAVSGSTTHEAHVVLVAEEAGAAWRRCSRTPAPSPTAAVSVGVPWTVEVAMVDEQGPVASDGQTSGAATRRRIPGLLFLPWASAQPGSDGETANVRRPPLVVLCHGGPTGAAGIGYDPLVQCLTSRGIAVACVDYRGSSGHGRAFRTALAGLWGVADVEDCTAYAEALAADGIVDGARMAIRGSSAGGLTALAALAASDVFVGAVSWYGVTDLEALARDTHDFESRYLDGLVGPWPDAAALYRERSPIHAAGRMSGSVLLLQGADDPVVPAAQSQEFAVELEAAGVDCHLIVFPEESHGFRRADTITAALEAELAFYERVFEPDGVGVDAS